MTEGVGIMTGAMTLKDTPGSAGATV